jgi:hypothetical protein
MYSCHNDPHEAILLKTRTPATTFDIIAKLRDIVKPTFRMDVVPLNQEVFDDELSGFHQQLPLRCATNPPDVIAVALRPGRRFGRGGGRAPGLMELRNRREFGDLQEYIHNKGFTQIPIPEPIVEEVTENIVAR